MMILSCGGGRGICSSLSRMVFEQGLEPSGASRRLSIRCETPRLQHFSFEVEVEVEFEFEA